MKTTIYTSIFLLISFLSFSQQKNPTNSGSLLSVTIGEQVWMSENLNVTTFRNGDPIIEAKSKDDMVKFTGNKTPAWCYYNFNPENGKKYGKLYNKYAVIDPRGLAPKGWIVPEKGDIEILAKELGSGINLGFYTDWRGNELRTKAYVQNLKSIQGWESSLWKVTCNNCSSWSEEYKKKVPCHICKDTRITGYEEESNNGNNSTGFNALPGGFVISQTFEKLGLAATWWLMEQSDYTNENWYKLPYFYIENSGVSIYTGQKEALDFCYVRCIKANINENDTKIIDKLNSSILELKKNFKTEILPNLISDIGLLSSEKDRKNYFNKMDIIIAEEITNTIVSGKFDYGIQLIEIYKTIPNHKSQTISHFEHYLKPHKEYITLISPVKNLPLSTDETKIIGDWDFRSKNIKTGDGRKSYLVDVIRFNKDRTFYFLLQEHDARDDSKLHKLEKTGYWKFENNKLTFYVDFETDDKQKTRINKTETINFSELVDNEAAKTLEIGSLKIEMKGKKRL